MAKNTYSMHTLLAVPASRDKVVAYSRERAHSRVAWSLFGQ